MKLLFFGSPEFAVPSLRAVVSRFEVELVVSQPDKRAGRGMTSSRPAVAREALKLGLPLAQPARLKRNDEFLRQVSAIGADVAITVAYGKILPKQLLEIPRHGFLNVHASLLPRYRGAGPVQWALINGDRTTGVSIMRTEEGLDTGPVCLARRLTIEPHERSPQLFERLSELGAKALLDALEQLEAGRLECAPQEDAEASYAPLLQKEDGDIDWRQSASSVYDRFRGVFDWPGSRFYHAGRPVKVLEMRPVDGEGRPAEVLEIGKEGVTVAVGDGAIELLRLQPAGKGTMKARDWANGYRITAGAQLDEVVARA